MHLPVTNDTIVAVSTSWEPAPLGIIRLSGPDAFRLVACVTDTSPMPDSCPGVTSAVLRLPDDLSVPADLFWFRAPRSYTGQDLVEIHTIGSLPLLRLVAGELLHHGARRALPGEYTARAYLNRRLDASQVDAVLSLVTAENAGAARRAARASRHSRKSLIDEVTETLSELLARIEAGIDFVEEEDVQIIAREEVYRTLTDVLARIDEALRDRRGVRRASGAHVALVGLPNAGKSTLFNALLGYDRAIVSPVLGTTRDVLSAEVHMQGHTLVMQDCAGLGHTPDEIELAAHVAAERAADEADVVLWVHDNTTAWTLEEEEACTRLRGSHTILVRTKTDLSAARGMQPAKLEFAAETAVCALRARGVEDLRRCITGIVDSGGDSAGMLDDQLARIRPMLARAEALARVAPDALPDADLIALELRAALSDLRQMVSGAFGEDLLGRIFGSFCIGK